MKLLIASNNAHKVQEIKAILKDFFDEMVTLTDFVIEVPAVKPVEKGDEVLVYVRPEEFVFTDSGHGMEAKVLVKRFLGKYIQYVMDCGIGTHVEVTADTSSAERIHEAGETVYLGINTRRVNLFDAKSETTLMEGVSSNV